MYYIKSATTNREQKCYLFTIQYWHKQLTQHGNQNVHVVQANVAEEGQHLVYDDGAVQLVQDLNTNTMSPFLAGLIESACRYIFFYVESTLAILPFKMKT